MFVLSPNSKNNKIMKKKKELHKKKEGHTSKMMKSGSMSNMFQNTSITDSNSKKTLSRQKTSGVLQTIPYNVKNHLLAST